MKPSEVQVKTVNSDDEMDSLTYEVLPGDGTEFAAGETEILGLTVTVFGDDIAPLVGLYQALEQAGYASRNAQNWVLR